MSMLQTYQREVLMRLDAGEDLGALEREVIDVVPGLSEDERAALWLYAWSYRRGCAPPATLAFRRSS